MTSNESTLEYSSCILSCFKTLAALWSTSSKNLSPLPLTGRNLSVDTCCSNPISWTTWWQVVSYEREHLINNMLQLVYVKIHDIDDMMDNSFQFTFTTLVIILLKLSYSHGFFLVFLFLLFTLFIFIFWWLLFMRDITESIQNFHLHFNMKIVAYVCEYVVESIQRDTFLSCSTLLARIACWSSFSNISSTISESCSFHCSYCLFSFLSPVLELLLCCLWDPVLFPEPDPPKARDRSCNSWFMEVTVCKSEDCTCAWKEWVNKMSVWTCQNVLKL